MTHYTPGLLVAKQRVIDSFHEAIILIDSKGTLLKLNESAKALLKVNDVNGQSIEKYINFERANRSSNKVLLKSQNKWLDINVIELNRDLFFIILRGLSLTHSSKSVQQSIDTILQSSNEGMLMYDQNNLIDCDDTVASMFNYDKEQLLKKHLEDIFQKEREYLYGIKSNGEKFPVEIIGSSDIRKDDVTVVLVKDISARIEYEQQIEKLAYYSELTDLPNKNYFLLKLKKEVNKAKITNDRIAVFYIDLKYFKALNETLGHNFGDKLLKACGERLQYIVKDEKNLVAHVHGDEFLMMQQNIENNDDVDKLARTLINAFEQPIIIDNREVHISISIGISMYPTDSVSPHELIKHAHSAMYLVNEKDNNNYYRFNKSISERFKKRLLLEEDLRHALKRNEFELYYQPQVSLHDSKVIGVEALIRWVHPKKGIISPLSFIPFAEETGLIMKIDHWVIIEACKQSVQWIEDGYEAVQISVNVSAKQFLKNGFVEFLEDVIVKTKANPNHLELEITESMAMTNEETVLKIVQDIRKLGVSVVIDDFGTGYSSLKYLSLYPINKLKIDKMFIQNTQKENEMIVKSIIHLSHALNMKVVAEGVETEEQKKFLKGLNCDQVQGYYFSKPLSSKYVVKFFNKQAIS